METKSRIRDSFTPALYQPQHFFPPQTHCSSETITFDEVSMLRCMPLTNAYNKHFLLILINQMGVVTSSFLILSKKRNTGDILTWCQYPQSSDQSIHCDYRLGTVRLFHPKLNNPTAMLGLMIYRTIQRITFHTHCVRQANDGGLSNLLQDFAIVSALMRTKKPYRFEGIVAQGDFALAVRMPCR